EFVAAFGQLGNKHDNERGHRVFGDEQSHARIMRRCLFLAMIASHPADSCFFSSRLTRSVFRQRRSYQLASLCFSLSRQASTDAPRQIFVEV
ncbi:MAG: hypothetical protein ACKOJB_02145, partial [Chthoniobacterales bacterium]